MKLVVMLSSHLFYKKTDFEIRKAKFTIFPDCKIDSKKNYFISLI